MKDKIQKSISSLEKWIEAHDYKGYEPFDGLLSYLRPLTFGNRLLEQILQQTIRQSPFELRGILGVKPLESTKGMGYIARGYLNLYKITGEKKYKDKTDYCLNWLIENRTKKYQEYSWGNHFDYASRSGRLPKFEPTIVWTSLIGQAFLDAYETLKDEKYLEAAKSVCRWIVSLPREITETGLCISYVYPGQSYIHNSNMLGAAMLARTAKITGDKSNLPLAKEAMLYSCTRQNPDGAWYYGHDPTYHWIDNFHTGYNLDALKCYIDNSEDKTFEENLARGYQYFKDHFFEDNGLPKYYYNRAYPLDIQCASQAIDTLVNFSFNDKPSLEIAKKVANWTIDNMQDKTGYFYYRILPLKTVKTPMIHWGQATMYKSLTYLLNNI
jgi:rhamnogalacturonyl hydrolase YesR